MASPLSTAPARWSFYGRERELAALVEAFRKRSWFFLRVSGRRRIGKTTLVRQALGACRA